MYKINLVKNRVSNCNFLLNMKETRSNLDFLKKKYMYIGPTLKHATTVTPVARFGSVRVLNGTLRFRLKKHYRPALVSY